jgi:hypothetical protein
MRLQKRTGFVTGHDFSRAEEAAKSTRALAPEGTPDAQQAIVPRIIAPGGNLLASIFEQRRWLIQ